MSDTTKNNAQYTFSRDGEQVRNIKFYFRPNSTAAQLDDYRNRAWAQIREDVSIENTTLDRDLVD